MKGYGLGFQGLATTFVRKAGLCLAIRGALLALAAFLSCGWKLWRQITTASTRFFSLVLAVTLRRFHLEDHLEQRVL